MSANTVFEAATREEYYRGEEVPAAKLFAIPSPDELPEKHEPELETGEPSFDDEIEEDFESDETSVEDDPYGIDPANDYRDLSWKKDALCQSSAGISRVFFPPNADKSKSGGAWGEKKAEKLERIKIAKSFCGSCAVREECLNYALQGETLPNVESVWGGMTGRERQHVKDFVAGLIWQ